MPILSELAATADICHHIYAATIEPEAASEVKIGRHANAVTAVSIKQRRIVAVGFRPFTANNVERNFCVAFRSREFARYFNVGKRNRRSIDQRRLEGLGFSRGDFEPGRRLGVTHVAEQERSVFEREHLLNSRDVRNRDNCFIFSI